MIGRAISSMRARREDRWSVGSALMIRFELEFAMVFRPLLQFARDAKLGAKICVSDESGLIVHQTTIRLGKTNFCQVTGRAHHHLAENPNRSWTLECCL